MSESVDHRRLLSNEVDCQQMWPVIHRLLNKTPDFPRL